MRITSAVVIGAAGGIGKALAARLCSAGAHVVLADGDAGAGSRASIEPASVTDRDVALDGLVVGRGVRTIPPPDGGTR